MEDDLNTADALAALFNLVKDINKQIADKAGKTALEESKKLFDEICSVLGLVYNRKKDNVDDEILKLVEARTQARKNRDFATADKIRDELKAMGITLEDTPDGVKIVRS